jgi:transposase-like protein
MKCPKCDRYMDSEEKDTSSGRDMRTYFCPPCKKRVDVDNGIALWKALSDARAPGRAYSRNRVGRET